MAKDVLISAQRNSCLGNSLRGFDSPGSNIEVRVLNQAVRRNIKRFPEDFMFELTHDEIMRAFVRLRQTLAEHEDLKRKRAPFAYKRSMISFLYALQ